MILTLIKVQRGWKARAASEGALSYVRVPISNVQAYYHLEVKSSERLPYFLWEGGDRKVIYDFRGGGGGAVHLLRAQFYALSDSERP